MKKSLDEILGNLYQKSNVTSLTENDIAQAISDIRELIPTKYLDERMPIPDMASTFERGWNCCIKEMERRLG